MDNNDLGNFKFSLKDLFFVVFYKLHVFFVVYFLIIVLTALYAFNIDPIYRTSAYILLKPLIDSRKLPIAGQHFFDVEPLTEIDINTELEIITSQEVVLDVVEKLNIEMPKDEAVKYISKNVKASSVTASFAIRISKEGGNPEDITRIVNAYIDAYISRHIDVHRSRNEIHFYARKTKEKEIELYSKQKKLLSLVKRYNIIDIDIQKEKYIESILSLKEKYIKIELDLSRKKNIIDSIKKNNFDIDVEEFRGSESIKNIFLTVYPSLLQEKEKVFSLYTDSSVEYKDIFDKIDRFNKELKKEKEKILDGIYLDVTSLEFQSKILIKEMKNIENKLKELSYIENEYKNIVSSIDQIKSTYTLYLNKLEDEKIQEQMDISGASNLSIISRAHVPARPIFPRKIFMLISAVIVGFCASISATFIVYYLDHTVKREEDILLLTKIPVIASLEKIKNASSVSIFMDKTP